jgi:RHS repeat-associated protein
VYGGSTTAEYGHDGSVARVAGGVTKATAYSHNAAHELTQLIYSEGAAAQYTKTYGYDAAGDTTRVTKQGNGLTTVIHTYDWDAAARLTRAQVDTGGNVKTIEYAYNAANLRVRRVDTSTNVTKLYSYQGHNLASIQKSQSGAYTANEWVYTVAPGMISNALEKHQVSAGGGSTTSQYYQYDHRGNVVAVSDSTGDIQYGYQYDAFGNIMFSFDEGAAAAPTDDILFTGKDLDPDTGLYCFNARWYEPQIGLFLSPTSTGADSEHPYLLAEANPLGFVDVEGRNSQQIGLGIWGLTPWGNTDYDPFLAYSCAKYAKDNSRLLGGQESGPGDALRHCLWGCCMTLKLSAEGAEAWGQAHEGNGKGRRVEMDRYNNSVGIDIAETDADDLSDCICKCHDALNNGHLVYRKNYDGSETDWRP